MKFIEADNPVAIIKAIFISAGVSTMIFITNALTSIFTIKVDMYKEINRLISPEVLRACPKVHIRLAKYAKSEPHRNPVALAISVSKIFVHMRVL